MTMLSTGLQVPFCTLQHAQNWARSTSWTMCMWAHPFPFPCCFVEDGTNDILQGFSLSEAESQEAAPTDQA